MNTILMHPRDYEDLMSVLHPESSHGRRARRADKLLQQLGYTQLGQYDAAHKIEGLPLTVLHGIKFVRPHYYAVVVTMVNILQHCRTGDILPPPNMEHLRLAEFLFHAPRCWWRSLDPHRAHILTCVEANSSADVTSAPTGRSQNFQMAGGPRVVASPHVPRNTLYTVHNTTGTAIAKQHPNPGSLTIQNQPPPQQSGIGYWIQQAALTPQQAARLHAFPDLESVTKPYETPLFTWLIEFTKPIRSLSLNSAAVV